jgi:hypothetical protein
MLTKAGQTARRKIEEGGEEGLWRGGIIIDTPGEFTEKSKWGAIQRSVREFGGMAPFLALAVNPIDTKKALFSDGAFGFGKRETAYRNVQIDEHEQDSHRCPSTQERRCKRASLEIQGQLGMP